MSANMIISVLSEEVGEHKLMTGKENREKGDI